MIDSHAHLNDKLYNVAEIVANMKEDGLSKIVVVGYDIASSRRAVELSRVYDGLYAAVGIHPSDCAKISEDNIKELLHYCSFPKTVAFGEIGLDYHYDTVDRETQKKALVLQLLAAKESGLPVMFHLRDAYEDMDAILKEYEDCLAGGVVMHCFSGSKETAVKYANRGYYISFSGSITFKNAVKYTDIIKAVPLDRIIIETDCPYLTPVPHRGKLNYPAYVRFQAMKIAEVLGKSVEEISEITERNTLEVYKKLKNV